MILNGNGISLEYQKEMRRLAAGSKKKCPSAALLMKLARGAVRSGQRERLIRHLGICPGCAREYSSIFKIVREEKRFVREAAKIRKAAAAAGGERTGRWQSLPALSWRSGLAAALIVCMAAAGTIFLTRSLRTTSELRSGSIYKLKTIAPIKKAYAADKIVFKWETLDTSDYYMVELFDWEMRLVWKSPRIDGPNLGLPAETAGKIQEEGRYFWMVTAFLTGGGKVESDLSEFFVKK
jgi:hypothetical protein